MAKAKTPVIKLSPEEALAAFVLKVQKPGARQNIFIGIDPGAEGALGLLCGRECLVLDIPTSKMTRAKKTKSGKRGTTTIFDEAAICRLFNQLKPVKERVHIILEQQLVQSARKFKQTLQTAFRVGYSFGMWPLFLTSRRYSFETVYPVVWKKAMGLTGKDKPFAMRLAQRMFPKADLVHKCHHNRAEALLLAVYGQRRFVPETDRVRG